MAASFSSLDIIYDILKKAKETALSSEERQQLAVQLAAQILKESVRHTSKEDSARLKELAQMMQDPIGKAFTIRMVDECFRSHDPVRVANQLVYLLTHLGIPGYVNLSKKIGLKLFQWLGKRFSRLAVWFAIKVLRQETATVILPGEKKPLATHMQKRRAEGVQINLNHLGEAILGEEEALKRLNTYLEDLKNPLIEYVSIKISTIFSQINLLAWEKSKTILADRLRRLYQAAKDHHFTRSDGTKSCKFVNLDMEEYKDLRLTVDLFMTVLDEKEFDHFSAGIVLQAYLPDSYSIQKELTLWAQKRVQSGKAPIKIRIVKGANLAMEALEASLKGWPQAPYHRKIDTDANYRKMVNYGLLKENAAAVHLGIASHNIFDIAYALIIAAQNGTERWMQLEMLEGMAQPTRKAVGQITSNILLYCPVAKKSDFQSAVAYLIRRLDENTGKDNFLKHSFGLKPDSKEWDLQAKFFLEGCLQMEDVKDESYRWQNRMESPQHLDIHSPFTNEADTDFSLLANRKWITSAIGKWKTAQLPIIPATSITGTCCDAKQVQIGTDPSCITHTSYHYLFASWQEVSDVLSIAKGYEKTWQETALEKRCELLSKVAMQLRIHRDLLISVMIKDGAKTVTEADAEISEAIDFAEYYLRSAQEVMSYPDVQLTPKGTYLIAPPWNFPVSIPVGGILSALVMGNCVVFKPAPETILIGWSVINLLWDAGIPKEALSWLICEDEPIGGQLLQDPRINSVILTGATATAALFLNHRKDLDLSAETGGKNGIIVTALSDKDLAIKEVIHSAFSHAGQKCSAASLLVLEKQVYDDPHFLQQLKDAAQSLWTGSAWDLSAKITPLIRPASKELHQGLTELEEGQTWLLQPKQDALNPHLWSAGIKLGVKPHSFMHTTELFGPVLSVMRAENLEDAISIVNQTEYGLTSGLFSLDEREHSQWISKIEAGNLYINRSITGAIVMRQPFGGCKSSQYGVGLKAGGPNYLTQFVHCTPIGSPEKKAPIHSTLFALMEWIQRHVSDPCERKVLEESFASYSFWNQHFDKKHELAFLTGQDNILEYRPYPKLSFRIQTDDALVDIFRVMAAAILCRVSLEVSVHQKVLVGAALKECALDFNWIHESEEQFVSRVRQKKIRRIRLLSPPSESLLSSCAQTLTHIQKAPVCSNGRFELLHYLQEVVVSFDYHRYGNLGLREGEQRKPCV